MSRKSDSKSTAKPPASQKQVDANRRNAQKSTGPRTAEGKKKSRGNAMKHGLCAIVIPMPDEDPEEFKIRAEGFNNELNPCQTLIGMWLARNLARKTMQIDRCHETNHAEVAKLARDAVRDAVDARKRAAELVMPMLLTDPAEACLRLKSTPEGCDVLLREWNLLYIALRDFPPPWDSDDGARAEQLLGENLHTRGKGPGRFVHAQMMIDKYRTTLERLRAHREEQMPAWDDRVYHNPLQLESDAGGVDKMGEAAANSVMELRAILDREIADLKARKLELTPDAELDDREAPVRARFDASPRGQLMVRYAVAAERGVHQAIKQLMDLTRFTLEVDGLPADAANGGGGGAAVFGTSPARNEANFGGSAGGDGGGVDRRRSRRGGAILPKGSKVRRTNRR
jgi:hypothetical protein